MYYILITEQKGVLHYTTLITKCISTVLVFADPRVYYTTVVTKFYYILISEQNVYTTTEQSILQSVLVLLHSDHCKKSVLHYSLITKCISTITF